MSKRTEVGTANIQSSGGPAMGSFIPDRGGGGSIKSPLEQTLPVNPEDEKARALKDDIQKVLGPNATEAAKARAQQEVATDMRAAGQIPPRNMTLASATALKNRIEEIKGNDNPLNTFLNVNYRFRFFMAQDDDFVHGLYGDDLSEKDIPVAKVFEALENSPQVTIAQSGVTAGLNIRDVRIEQVVGPTDRFRNTNATLITMEIVEPLGTSLLETMRNAAIELRVRNLDKAPYFLELTFVGYSEPGEPIVNPLSNDQFDNGGRWLYEVQITNIETELDSQGSRYTLSMRPMNESALDDYLNVVPAAMNAQGSTVGEFLDNFAQRLNETWNWVYGRKVYKIAFKLHEINNLADTTPPRNFRIGSTKPEEESNRNFYWFGSGVPNMHMTSGTRIQEVIDHLFASTDQGAEIVKAVKATMTTDQSKGQSTAELFRKAVLFRIEPDVNIGIYDSRLNVYHKQVTFHIWGYYTQQPILSRAQEENAMEDSVQSRMVTELMDRGFFRKRYDYLFTGLNTEVLRLDIRYNMAWNVALPTLAQYGTDIEQEVTNAKVADQSISDQIAQDKRDSAIDKVNEETEERNKLSRSLSTENLSDEDRKRLTAEIAARNANIATAQATVSSLNSQMQEIDLRVRREDQDIKASRAHQGKWRGFAEDLNTPSVQDKRELPLMLSYRQMKTGEGKQQTGNGFEKPVNGERGIYGAVLEQVYGPLTTGLVNIEMEIRGDPYWLSYSNVERRLHMRASTPPPLQPNPKVANYVEGDNVVLINFLYPYNVDGVTGDINVRANGQGKPLDKFTGLYRVTKVVHTFSGGEFRQTLTGSRYSLVDIARALNYDGVENGGVVSAGDSGLRQTMSPQNFPARNQIDGSQPRGIRNNNPGNIRVSGDNWVGSTGNDGSFVTFDTPENGIRAMAINLRAKQNKHGLNTLEEIIGDEQWGWAPDSDGNDSKAYAARVAKRLGVSPTATINLNDRQTLETVVAGMIQVENNKQPYSQQTISTGVGRALGGGG